MITWDGSSQISVQNLNPQSEIGNITLGAGIGQIRPRLVFAGDGSRLAVSVTTNRGGSPSVQVFDIAMCKSIQQVQNLSRPPGQLALSTNGAMLAVAPETEDPSIEVFDVNSGRELKRFTGLHGCAAWLALAGWQTALRRQHRYDRFGVGSAVDLDGQSPSAREENQDPRWLRALMKSRLHLIEFTAQILQRPVQHFVHKRRRLFVFLLVRRGPC